MADENEDKLDDLLKKIISDEAKKAAEAGISLPEPPTGDMIFDPDRTTVEDFGSVGDTDIHIVSHNEERIVEVRTPEELLELFKVKNKDLDHAGSALALAFTAFGLIDKALGENYSSLPDDAKELISIASDLANKAMKELKKLKTVEISIRTVSDIDALRSEASKNVTRDNKNGEANG